MKEKSKNILFTALFIAGLAIFIPSFIFLKQGVLAPHWDLLAFLPAFLLLEAKILYQFFDSLLERDAFGEEILVLVASGITIGLGDYIESLSLIVMYMIGEFIIHLVERNNCPEHDHETAGECTCCHPHSKSGKGVMAFIKYYIVAVLAGITIVLVLSLFMNIIDKENILVALASLLLIACPCTLFISAPLCKYYAVKAFHAVGQSFDDLDEIDVISKAKRSEDVSDLLKEHDAPDTVFTICKLYKRKMIQNICIIIATKVLCMVLSVYLAASSASSAATLIAVAADMVIALLVFFNTLFLGYEYRRGKTAK